MQLKKDVLGQFLRRRGVRQKVQRNTIDHALKTAHNTGKIAADAFGSVFCLKRLGHGRLSEYHTLSIRTRPVERMQNLQKISKLPRTVWPRLPGARSPSTIRSERGA